MAPSSTISAESETSTAFQTTEVALATPGVREMATAGVREMATPGVREMATPGVREMATPGVREMAVLSVGYAALTVFLLILVVISFVRFHRARVTQNRQRLEAIADQLEKDRQTAAVLAARRGGLVPAAGDDPHGGGVHPDSSSCPMMSSVATTSSSYVPAYLDLFLSFSEPTSVR